ncbi:MAG: hypothetical protein FJZ58_06185 [Chlamydiae bacterium]|nr:hypothetical protein [Chlamydiota bacterium]
MRRCSRLPFLDEQVVFTGSCGASYGELLQGVLPNNEYFLATQRMDLSAIGAIATESALLHQLYNCKQGLYRCIELAHVYEAFGIINTHSGTCLGFLLDKDMRSFASLIKSLLEAFPDQELSLYTTA